MIENPLTESHIAEAANAAANAEEARQKAFQASSRSQREETKDIFVHAMREVLTEGDEGTKVLLLQKIPLLCTDVLTIKKDIELIKKIGGYILVGIGSLFLTLVGALLLRAI